MTYGNIIELPEPTAEPQGVTLPGDAGRARVFVNRNADRLRFVHAWDCWLVHESGRWNADTSGGVVRLALETGRSLMAEAFSVTGEAERKRAISEASAWGSTAALRQMLELAKHDERVTLHCSEVDANPWHLGVPGAVVDLRTGATAAEGGYTTRTTGVAFDAGATCPRWEKFFAEVFPDAGIREYIRLAIGSTLSGDTRDHHFLFAYGSGCNGKSTLLETLAHVFGTYAGRAGADLINTSRYSREPEGQIAELAGLRLVIGAETSEGSRLNEGLIKDISGGDTLRGRKLYQSAFSFQPQCTLWLFGNHRPSICGTDEGIWRRVRLLPFLQSFAGPRKDPSLKDGLRTEGPGILAWCVRACMDWQRMGLEIPEGVKAATSEYRADEDVLGDFIADATEELIGFTVTNAELFRAYERWAEVQGMRKTYTAKGLAKRLRERGWADSRGMNGLEWRGRRLKND